MHPLHSISALLQSVFRDQQRNSLWQKQGSHLTSSREKEIKSEYYQHGVTDQHGASVIVTNENWDTSNLTVPEHTRLFLLYVYSSRSKALHQ